MKTRRRLGTPHRLQGDVELKKEERKKKDDGTRQAFAVIKRVRKTAKSDY